MIFVQDSQKELQCQLSTVFLKVHAQEQVVFTLDFEKPRQVSDVSDVSDVGESTQISLHFFFYFPVHTGYDLHLVKACHEAGEEIRDFLGDQPVKIVASGISSFNGQTLALTKKTRGFQIQCDLRI